MLSPAGDEVLQALDRSEVLLRSVQIGSGSVTHVELSVGLPIEGDGTGADVQLGRGAERLLGSCRNTVMSFPVPTGSAERRSSGLRNS